MGLIGVFGTQRQASAWLRDPANWMKIRLQARKHWDLELRKNPPCRTTVYNNLVQLAESADHIRKSLVTLAVKQAQQQGCLVETASTMNKPPQANVIAADGTVLKTRRRAKTLERLKAEGKGCNFPPRYKEGGDNGSWVAGYKELVMVVRPDNHPNSRVILGVMPVPKEGYGGEAGIAVDELSKLREMTKGFLGLRYDGAFTGTHIDAMQKLGVSVISPVPKNNAQNPHDTVKCKAGHVHSLFTEGGDFIELTFLDTGETHPSPCKRVDQYARRNADGSYRWYAKLKLWCGEHHTERLDITETDRKRGYNRTQVVRMHPPESDEYKNTYGWRQDVESVNNNLDTTLYRHRMIVDTAERQAIVMVGFAMARNAISAKVFEERQRRGLLDDPPDQAPKKSRAA